MKRFSRYLMYVLLFVLLSSLCGCSVPPAPNSTKLQIVVTSFPPYDFARQLAGDHAEVTMLLSPGQESHTFEPTPQDILKLAQADLFILGGGASDEWAKRMIASSELDAKKALSMMDCVESVPEELSEGMQQEYVHETHHNHKEADHSKYYTYDEHVWTAPKNAMKICEEIAERLIAADSANAATYQENLNAYLGELSALDNEFSEIAETGTRTTIVFADRFPFRYFADCYNLTYFAAFPGCAGETEPDAATMKFLIDKVQEERIPAIFYTELSNRKIASAISEATGAKQLLLHSCHNVTKNEFERGETYVSLMRQNAAALKEALS